MATNNDFVIEFIGQLDKSELNKAIEEFSRKQIDLRVNTDEIKEAIKEFAKANDIKISTREIDAWTKKFIQSQKEAMSASQKRLEYERDLLKENSDIEDKKSEQTISNINAQTMAQSKFNETIAQTNVVLQQGSESQTFLKMSSDYDKIGKKLKGIRDSNVGFLNDNKELQAETQRLLALWEQLRQVMASGDINSISAGLTTLKQNVDGLDSSIKQAKSSSQTFAEMLKENFTKFGAWSIITMSYFQMIRGIQDAVDQVIELDASLVELKKVTDLSGSSLQKFTEDAFKAGQEVGRTGKEVIDATAEFARAGYAVKDALDLGTEALKLKNVGDGIDSVSDASLTLISVMKAYKMEASEAGRVTDILNEVSNNAAIGFAELADGVRRSSSILSQADTSLEETVSLLTGANVIMQNIEKTSSGLNTISARLRGIKDESDDTSVSVAKLGDDFKRIADVDILDQATGQLRSTYDILQDLAKVYPTLTKNQQQYLGKKFQPTNLLSINNLLCWKPLRAL